MKKIWRKWIKLTKKFANSVANILLALTYFLLIVPLAWILQQFFQRILLGHNYVERSNSFWIKKKKSKQDLSFAKEQ